MPVPNSIEANQVLGELRAISPRTVGLHVASVLLIVFTARPSPEQQGPHAVGDAAELKRNTQPKLLSDPPTLLEPPHARRCPGREQTCEQHSYETAEHAARHLGFWTKPVNILLLILIKNMISSQNLWNIVLTHTVSVRAKCRFFKK